MSVDFVPVESSNVSEVAWDAEADEGKGRMLVRFKTGTLYSYACPVETYRGLLEAPSVGKFLHVVVKPNYEARREEG